MKIDPKLIQSLLTLPDDQLWATVRAFAASKNISLSESPPPAATMASLRGAFSNSDKFDLASAVKILSNYRTRKKE